MSSSTADAPNRRPWTYSELKLAFHLYCQTPFGRMHGTNPDVVQLAALIGRTPGAVAMKLCNLASLDPEIIGSGRRALGNASRADREIRAEFLGDWNGLTIECARLKAALMEARPDLDPLPVDEPAAMDEEDSTGNEPDFTGRTRRVSVEQRIGQGFFRRAVLSEYQNRCCMSGLADARLLTASHIVPWGKDAKNRLNPANGLCLSAIHDRAFDKGLLALTDDLHILIARELQSRNDSLSRSVLIPLEGRPITRPERFSPDIGFVAWHRQNVFVDAA